MILIGVGVKSRREPAVLVLPDSPILIGRDAELDGPLRDGVPEDAGRVPVDRLAAAVVVDLAVLMEPIVDHPVQHLVDVGALQNAVAGCPADGLCSVMKISRLVAGLGKGLLSRDAIAINVVAPHRKRLRDDDVLRRCAYESGDMRRRRRQYVPRSRQGSALGSGRHLWHRVFLPLAIRARHVDRVREGRSRPARTRLLSTHCWTSILLSPPFHSNRGGVPGGAYLPDGGGSMPGVPTLPAPGCELAPALEAGGGGSCRLSPGCLHRPSATSCRTGRWRGWRTGGCPNVAGGRYCAPLDGPP